MKTKINLTPITIAGHKAINVIIKSKNCIHLDGAYRYMQQFDMLYHNKKDFEYFNMVIHNAYHSKERELLYK